MTWHNEALGAAVKIFVRMNHIGWIHLWPSREAYDAGEASVHFFNGRTEPRWLALKLAQDIQTRLLNGELVEVEDPGYLE